MKLQKLLHATILPKFAVYWPEFGNKYEDADHPEKMEFVLQEYAQQLVAHRITSDMLKSGMKKALKLKYRPNPYEFAQLCIPTPQELGIPTEQQVFDDIVLRRGRYKGQEFEFSHRLIEIIDERIGYRMYRMDEKKFRQLLTGEYGYWLDRAIRDDLPEFKAALVYRAPEDTRAPIDVFISRTGHKPKLDAKLEQRLAEIRAQQVNKGAA